MHFQFWIRKIFYGFNFWFLFAGFSWDLLPGAGFRAFVNGWCEITSCIEGLMPSRSLGCEECELCVSYREDGFTTLIPNVVNIWVFPAVQ